MSKKNKNTNSYALMRKGKAIKEQMASKTKKGKFKNKEAKRGCIHSKLNKKGKFLITLVNTHDNECTCDQCEKTFPIKVIDKDELKKDIVEPVIKYTDQAIIMATSIGDDNAVRVFKKYKLSLYKFPKLYKRVSVVASRNDKSKKKKKYGGGGRPLGSFAER